MFDSFELPPPQAVTGLDDIGLIDTMELATVLETMAVDVQVAVIQEICRRQIRGAGWDAPDAATCARAVVVIAFVAPPTTTQGAKAAAASSLTQAE